MRLDNSSDKKPNDHEDLDISIPSDAICFGSYVLIPQRHLLLKNGKPWALHSRAMPLLIALASRPGELLEKAELLAIAWPKMVVEECNLRAQIMALRRVLADNEGRDFIITVPGRGYRFVATTSSPARSPGAPRSSNQVGMGFQSLTRRIFGREVLLDFLATQLASRRFVTIAGHGGVGKTTVALALAKRMMAEYLHGIFFVDLALANQEQPVHVVIAAAMGIECTTNDSLQIFTEGLGLGKVLLILDNCEHMLDGTAIAVEAILGNFPACSVLATSREPLNAYGEFVHNLAPLIFPIESSDLSTTQVLAFSAVEVLVERIAAHDMGYVFSDGDVQAAVAICRKLDGNALAIEIVAARVRAFGLNSLSEMLDSSFRLHMTGHRTSLPRHRTLSAALDWTYAMLSIHEQSMLGQLAIFTGAFTLRAVLAVVVIDTQDLLQVLEKLVEKSLVISLEEGYARCYRLLETTRMYASQKLAELDKEDATVQRHARWICNDLKTSVQELLKTTSQTWLAKYGAEVDSVRAALEWAYSPRGDQELALELTLISVPLWLRLSLIGECHDWVRCGLRSSGKRLPAQRHMRMKLLTVSASIMVLTFGGGAQIRKAWLQVSQDAQTLNDTEHQLCALWGRWTERSCGNQYVDALALADQHIRLSSSANSHTSQLLGLRMRANALFHMGRFHDALESALAALSSPLSGNNHLIDLHFDQRIAAHSLKAKIHLLQGRAGEALLTLDKVVGDAINLNHPVTLWYTLCLSAIPATLMVGDLQKTRFFLSVLQRSMDGHNLYLWRQLARCFEFILLIRQGDAEDGVPRLGEVLEQLEGQGGSPLYSLLRSEYSQGLAMLGLEQSGLHAIEQTLLTARRREDCWFIPGLLRVKAQILRLQGEASLPLVHRTLQEALNEARDQGAHFWLQCIAEDFASLMSSPH